MIAAATAPSVPIAFLAGLVSFLSPCVFPLMPAYAAYLSGRAGAEQAPTPAGGAAVAERRVPLLGTGIAFVIGFSVVFIAVFYVFAVLNVTVFARNLTLVNRIAGAIIVVFALQTLGVLRLRPLMRELRIQHAPGGGAGGAFVLGLTFAAGWTPCLGPQLGAILTLAQNREYGGLPFMLVYCVGLGVPFLVIALLADRMQGLLRRVNRHLGVINLIAGGVLLVFGLLMATGQLTVLNGLPFQSPFNV